VHLLDPGCMGLYGLYSLTIIIKLRRSIQFQLLLFSKAYLRDVTYKTERWIQIRIGSVLPVYNDGVSYVVCSGRLRVLSVCDICSSEYRVVSHSSAESFSMLSSFY
jgi:hypothetical protein